MRDYKKGNFLRESRPAQLFGGASSSTAAEQQQKRIFDKVWGAVEKVMGDMKQNLLNELKEPLRSVEEQEKTIEFVVSPRSVLPSSKRFSLGSCWI
jgi:exocyst complex component 2